MTAATSPTDGDGAWRGVHASCVAFRRSPNAIPGAPDPFGVLALGPPGSGKSALMLDLLAFGAILVADDWTELAARPAGLSARSRGGDHAMRIEARGVGLIETPILSECVVGLVVRLEARDCDGVRADAAAHERRLPPATYEMLEGRRVRAVDAAYGVAIASAVSVIARMGAYLDPNTI